MEDTTSGVAGSGDEALANTYYVHATQGQVGYDPEAMKHAIDDLISEMKDITAKGGHVTEFMTSELLYLMQGFGGERVGLDGQNQSQLTNNQQDASYIWSLIQKALSGQGAGKDPVTGQTSWETTVMTLEKIKAEIDAMSKTVPPTVSPTLAKQVDEIVGTIEGLSSGVSSWWNSQDKSKFSQQQRDAIDSAINGQDFLRAIYLIAQPANNEDPTKIVSQGNPQFMDTLTSQMTTLNQQLTGASQVMATLAKSDSKTLQSEETAFNNFLQMLKKMNAYLVQLQRTN